MTVETRTLIITGILIGLALLAGVIVAQIVQEFYYPTTGEIEAVNLSVTWVSDKTPVTDIPWGTLVNGSTNSLEAINITNIGTVPVTLTIGDKDHVGIISLTLTWNYTGILDPQESIIVEITQTLTAKQTWSYTTVITATQA